MKDGEDKVGKRFFFGRDINLYGGRECICGHLQAGTEVEVKHVGFDSLYVEVVDFPFGRLGLYVGNSALLTERPAGTGSTK